MATTLAGLAAAGATIYGTKVASDNASAANKRAGETAAAGLQDSQNQQSYTKALNALALQRSTAGSIDSRGSTASYDPATNTWRTVLSPEAAAIQTGNDAFTRQNQRDVTTGNAQTLLKNQTDARQAGTANNDAILSAIQTRGDADTARRRLINFQPQTAGELEGALQESATTANRQAEDPVIADTLRAMARNGTAAGPVLTQLQRDNATTLRQTMLQDKIASLQGVDSINNAQRSGLQSTFQTLDNAATPKLQFAGTSGLGSAPTVDPAAALSNEIASRANNAATSAIQAGSVNNQGRNADVASRNLAASYTPYDNSGDQISAIAKQITNLGSKPLTINNGQINQGSSLLDTLSGWLGKGAGNSGDRLPDRSGVVFGDGSLLGG